VTGEQKDAATTAGGTLVIYGLFCLAMLAIYSWSVHESRKLARQRIEEIDRLIADRATAPSRARTPKANGRPPATLDG
jgi:hypothetical protein